jgi:hypothetical protein
MGLKIVWDHINILQPRNEKCVPEEQQYIITRRPNDEPLLRPKPFPKVKK